MEKELIKRLEVKCSISHILEENNVASIDILDGTDVAFSVEVDVKQIPEGMHFEGAPLDCVVKKYSDGSYDIHFDYPPIDIEGLRKLAEKKDAQPGGMPPGMM